MKHRAIKNISLTIALIVLMTGCGKSSKLSDSALRDYIQSEAQKILAGEQYAVVWIPSRSAKADFTFIVLSKINGPSLMAKEIGKLLPEAKGKNLALVIGGPNNSKNTQVINDALDLNSKVNLKNLKIVFAGKATQLKDIKNKAERRGIDFYFIELKN